MSSQPHPSPSDQLPQLPTWKFGIEETRAKPRPWIWNEEEARKHRLEHPRLWRRLLARLCGRAAVR